jgi:hypothetical protein
VAKYFKDENENYTIEEIVLSNTGENVTSVLSSNGLYYFKNLSPTRSFSYEELSNPSKSQFGIFINVLDKNGKPLKRDYFIEKV